MNQIIILKRDQRGKISNVDEKDSDNVCFIVLCFVS